VIGAYHQLWRIETSCRMSKDEGFGGGGSCCWLSLVGYAAGSCGLLIRGLRVRVPAALPMATNCAAASAWPQDSNPPTRNPERRPAAAPRSRRESQRPMHGKLPVATYLSMVLSMQRSRNMQR